MFAGIFFKSEVCTDRHILKAIDELLKGNKKLFGTSNRTHQIVEDHRLPEISCSTQHTKKRQKYSILTQNVCSQCYGSIHPMESPPDLCFAVELGKWNINKRGHVKQAQQQRKKKISKRRVSVLWLLSGNHQRSASACCLPWRAVRTHF